MEFRKKYLRTDEIFFISLAHKTSFNKKQYTVQFLL